MRVRVDPEQAQDLAEFLRARVDAIVDRVAEDELEVSLLGSYTQRAMRLELFRRIRAWNARQPGARDSDVVPIAAALKPAATPADSGLEWSGHAASPSRDPGQG